ncbi:PcfJ domain-containing protein [Clostridium sp. AN503]|uniref:PcfJ domain-containing protein n=1 Tax=Clostridium sp. AN503 TaxID=3160598 RepID=UPI00345B02C4
MDKKMIAAMPHGEAEDTGKWARAYMVDKTLVLDCFESRKYIGRYCMQKNGRYDFFSEREQKWQKKRLNVAYGNPWYYSLDVTWSQGSGEIIKSFTGSMRGYRNGGIDYMEENYNSEKRDRAMTRKRDRINTLMDTVPVLPDGFYNWLNDTIFEGREYMFRESPDTWKCTACGKRHTSKKPYKNNQEVKCNRTGKIVMVKNRSNSIKRRENVLIFQQTTDPRWSVARHFTAERIWEGAEGKTEAYENIRYILGKNTISDQMTGNTVPYVDWYYGQYNQADEFEQDWWDSNRENKRCQSEYCYPDGVKEALKDTLYEKLRLETFADLGWKLQYNKVMINHNHCGYMEYFAKAGLRRLTEDASNELSVWSYRYNADWIDESGHNAAEVLGIDMQRFHRLRQNDGGSRYLEWLKYEQKTGKKLPEDTIQFLDESRIMPEDIKFIVDRMSPVQVANYLARQAKVSKKTPGSLLEYWKDYLSMAVRLELDVNDEIIYRAKELILRHDELVEQISCMNEDAEANKMRAKYPDVEKILERIKTRYEYENEKYLLVVPTRIEEIMRDGRQLHHCAASSERYFERISKQETYIMFLRRKSRPLHAWYTLEVEPGGTVRQKRSEYNRQPDLDEVKKFITEWHQELKARLKQEDQELAARSRAVRIMEMQELKVENERFAGVLEADLMEVG